MAILVDFRKVRENKQEVEYIYGYPVMDHRLLINKESQEGTPLGEKHRDFGGVVWKIVKYYKSEASWPEQGALSA